MRRFRRLPIRLPLPATLVVALLVAAIFIACDSKKSNQSPSLDGANPGGTTTSERKSWAGDKPAPALPGGLTWFNVAKPPTLAELQGKVVLLDFWTLGCINCQHIIPDLKALEAEFPNELVVIGVHSGKYAAEHDDDSVREAISRFGLVHPIVNDPDFVVWNIYGANAWPTLVLIDPAGNLVGSHSGEGVYDLFQPIISSLVSEFDEGGQVNRVPFITSPASSAASTVLSYPGKVLADEKGGRLFIADSGHNRILVANLQGELQMAIGSGAEGFADGTANEAKFSQPQGIALSPDGSILYVADTRNHAIRAVELPGGEVTTIAGTGKQLDRFPVEDSPAAKAALGSPWDVLVDGDTLYIAMAGIHQLWAIDLKSQTISVFAGTSREGIEDGHPRTMATLAQPSALTSGEGYLYWTDPESSSVRRVELGGGGAVETLVGTGLFDYGADDGPFEKAQLQHPQGIAFANGKLYVGDTYNHKVRVLDLKDEETETLAGSGARGWEDGDGDDAMFDEPGGMSVAGSTIYIADTNNHLVRTVDTRSGAVRTLALSNISAIASVSGRVLRMSLQEQTVAPGAGQLTLQISVPGDHRLNSQAPSRLSFASSNPAVLEPGETKIAWSSDEPGIEVAIPANYATGSAVLIATGEVYYCRKGEEALCFIQQIEVTLPVTIAPGGKGEATLNIELPPG